MSVQRYKGDKHMEAAYKDPQGDFVKYSDYELLEEIANNWEESSTANAEEADKWFMKYSQQRKNYRILEEKYKLLQTSLQTLDRAFRTRQVSAQEDSSSVDETLTDSLTDSSK